MRKVGNALRLGGMLTELGCVVLMLRYRGQGIRISVFAAESLIFGAFVLGAIAAVVGVLMVQVSGRRPVGKADRFNE